MFRSTAQIIQIDTSFAQCCNHLFAALGIDPGLSHLAFIMIERLGDYSSMFGVANRTQSLTLAIQLVNCLADNLNNAAIDIIFVVERAAVDLRSTLLTMQSLIASRL